jgi:hypothetical protein
MKIATGVGVFLAAGHFSRMGYLTEVLFALTLMYGWVTLSEWKVVSK